MNLLIVDDEEITREGIIERLPWSELGIEQIQQADDGINALRILEKFKPDIVLADVRMPRMDGIVLANHIKKLYPSCAIVFMSGYSDKEYLKAAIQLEAVDYVDKPIIIRELTSAIEKSIEKIESARIHENSKQLSQTYMDVGIPLLRNELALYLLNENINPVFIAEKAKAACIELPIKGFYVTAIIKLFFNAEHSVDHISLIKTAISNSLENSIQKHKIKSISVQKNDDLLILHLFSEPFEKHKLAQDKLSAFLYDATLPLESLCRFIVAVGNTYSGLANVYASYQTAVCCLEKFFFKEANCILFYGNDSIRPYVLNMSLIRNFAELIEQERQEETIFFLKGIIANLKRHENTPVKDVKDFFYTALLELCKISQQKGIDLFQYSTVENRIWEMFIEFDTLTEIEALLMDKLIVFFETLKQRSKNHSLIDKVYKYIQDHYSDPDLSIDKISESTHFAPTYICSIFKMKTDKTLNQYITQFRIEKAKEYLKNPDIKVSDIASMVGCKEGYFTKLFRKSAGITPSEYRERILQ